MKLCILYQYYNTIPITMSTITIHSKWGRFAKYLQDNSPIRYRKKGDTEWIDALVRDDRIYYYKNHFKIPKDTVYHVTATTKGNIDFSINKEGLNIGDKFEVFMGDMV